jgi:hypothetical protein
MIPYDLDPSLHSAEPESAVLDDGFSPPQQPVAEKSDNTAEAQSRPVDPALWAKSEF